MDHVSALEIADFIGQKYDGPDRQLDNVCPLNEMGQRCVTFSSKYSKATVEQINRHDNNLVIASRDFGDLLTAPHILSENPKYDFARVFAKFFPPEDVRGAIGAATLTVEDGVQIHNTIIGKNCYVKSNTVIGQKGFSFIPGPDGIPFPMPHKGIVRIGDNVEIGACCTIARGVMSDTIIGNNVKIDDQVHIGHNVQIGENTLITAGVEISGSAVIGKNVWIAPHCSILNHVEVGDGAYLCIASVVGKRVKPNTRVFGYPARKV